MRFSSVVVVVVLLFAPSRVHSAELTGERTLADAARQILDAWHAEAPEAADRSLHLVCWTPADRDLPADYQSRLTRIMQHIQNFYRREMKHFGFNDHTIRLRYDSDHRLILHTVRGLHPTAHYEMRSGDEIRRECLPTLRDAGIEPDRETILIMCNLATWDAEQLRFTHKSPYYAGGSFRSGTAWQLDSPELDALNLSLAEPIIQDGQYGRISLGKHNSIFIGGIAHELGHALGLPHCAARPDELVRGTALMGSGNRTYGDEIRGDGPGSFLTLAHALRLASHPQFSKSIKGLKQWASASLEQVDVTTDGKAIEVSGVVHGDPPIYAVVAYFDPEGGSDYNATTAVAVPAADGRFTLQSTALQHGKAGELRLFPLHANGSTGGQMSRTRFRYSYDVGQDGTPDLSTIQIRRQLTPIIDALVRRDREQARQLTDQLAMPRAIAIAKHLLDSPVVTGNPANFPGDAASVPLTQFKPELSQVGWDRPAFNRVPDDAMLLESGNHIFETGIYAHAPARHLYRLGGRWQSLAGQVGLAAGHPGTVEFELQGDGRSLWKSPVVRAGRTVSFDVKVDNVQRLELLTHPTDDGNGADWGLWLEPRLTRD